MPLTLDSDAHGERITVWQCIGCGKIEGPQPCIGICQDRRLELVYADTHAQALAQIERLRNQLRALIAPLRQLAFTTPRAGECERCYRALQKQAREALAQLDAIGGA